MEATQRLARLRVSASALLSDFRSPCGVTAPRLLSSVLAGAQTT